MAFKEIIKEIVDRADGGIAGLLMDADGIVVESYEKASVEVDIQALGVEYINLLQQCRKLCEENKAGKLSELSFITSNYTIIGRPITDDYFLTMVLSTDGNYGKARFLIRQGVPKLKEEL